MIKKKTWFWLLGRNCGNCVWFEGRSVQENEDGTVIKRGICRRNPPSPTFPKVASTEWCGEYK